MKYNKNLSDALVVALVEVENIDQLQAIYCTSDVADKAPAAQRVLHDLFQAERQRRSAGDVEELKLPDFANWHLVNLMESGVLLIAACETLSLMADPAITNFAFRLVQFFYGDFCKAHLEVSPCNA